jgi:hypothetical protein
MNIQEFILQSPIQSPVYGFYNGRRVVVGVFGCYNSGDGIIEYLYDIGKGADVHSGKLQDEYVEDCAPADAQGILKKVGIDDCWPIQRYIYGMARFISMIEKTSDFPRLAEHL